MTRRLGFVAAMALLGGCSSDAPGLSGAAGVGQALKGAAARIGSSAAPADSMAFELTPDMIAQTGGNVIMVRVASKGITAPMVLAGRNADVLTFSGGGVVSLSMRDGVILATRGFGDDLMSARTPTLRQLTSGARSYQRSYELLDGLNRLQEYTAGCNVEPSGTEPVSLLGRIITTRVIAETCVIDAGRIDNRYWISPAGKVVQARQWISPSIGFIEILLPG